MYLKLLNEKMGNLIGERIGAVPSKVRDSSLELFRIVLMLMIIAHHYIVNSGLVPEILKEGFGNVSVRGMILLMLGAWGKVCINCFVLITGYFMSSGRFSVRRFLKIYLEVLFYGVVIGLIFVLSGRQSFSLGMLFCWFWPFKDLSTGFISAFLALLLLVPFLNLFISHLNLKMHQLFLLVVLFFFSVLPTLPVPYIRIANNYVCWFVVLYFVGAYIRKYPLKVFECRWLMTFLSGTVFVVGCLSVMLMVNVLPCILNRPCPWSYFLIDAWKITALTAAVVFFLFFRSLRLPYIKIVNVVASATFGVLLIHANSKAMITWLWNDVCRNVDYYYAGEGALRAVGVVLCVYLVCVILDLLRQQLFALIGKTRIVKRINDRYVIPADGILGAH